jgi:hypothetical protein
LNTTPISEIHSDIFDPLMDSSDGLSGESLDPDQSDPEQGSTVELGGVESDDDTFTIARAGIPIALGTYHRGVATTSPVSPVTTQNLSGQSTSPPAVNGTETHYSGGGTAAPTVPLTNKQPGTETVSAIYTAQGPSLATAALASSSNPQKSVFSLLQTGQSGMSLGGNLVLYFILGVFIAIVSASLMKEF